MKRLLTLSTLFIVTFGENFKLTILHTNDIHGRIDEFDAAGSRCFPEAAKEKQCYGGIARQKYVVDSIRKTNPNTLFLNSGDYYQGTIWFYLMKGSIIADALRILQHDAMTLGNHEFDAGSVGLLPLLEQANVTGIPVLGCNVDFSKNPILRTFQPLPSIVLKRGGVDIGLIGFSTPETPSLSNVDYGTVFTDEIDCIKREATKLRKQGVKIIIAMGHSGYDKDQEIAAEVPLVRMVVGAHTHTYLSSVDQKQPEKPKGPYPTVVNRADKTKALVVQDFWLGKYLGYINVTFDSSSGEVRDWQGKSPLLLDYTVPKDEETEKFVQTKRVEVAAKSDVQIGNSAYVISGNREDCRFVECLLGNLLTDAVTNFFFHEADSPNLNNTEPIDIAVINGGAIRGTLPKGNITFEDMVTVCPFANALWVLPMSGQQVRQMYENGLKKYDQTGVEGNGGFLHSSGARLIADVTKPPLERVVSVKVWCRNCEKPEWQEIDPQKIYRVAVSAYTAQGGDNHDFTEIPNSKIEKLRINDLEVAIAHVKRNSPLHPVTDGRLQIITEVEKRTHCEPRTNGATSVTVHGSLAWIILTVTTVFKTEGCL